ncbi:MAG: sialidase family protein, partial [Ignavibacteria bacterium]
MKKTFSLLSSLIILFTLNVNAQIKDFPTTRFILPYAYTPQPYGLDNVDGVVSVGAFDNYTISTSAGFMETDVIVNRSNPLNFVVTDNRVITGANYVYYTTNGGISWSYSSVPTSYGDPVFAGDAVGNLYLSYLVSTGVRIQKSTNGGQSWNSAVQMATNTSADKEWIACDQTNGTYKNNVYMSYFNAATSNQRVDFHRSTNNGATWSAANILAATVSTNPGPNIVVDWTGKVYVFITTSSGAVCRVSTDGGVTFGSTISAAGYIEPGTINATTGRYCVKNNIRTNGHPQAATDLSNGPYKGYTYISYADYPPGPDIASVYCARTTNGGVSFDYSVLVNDDATYNDQWMPDVSVDDDGRVWVYWYDSRNDASNILTEIYGAVSTDGGATFSPN